jgi:phosphate transport system substrate-binding protein
MKNILRFFLILFIFVSCSKAEKVPEGEPYGYIQVKGSDTMVNVAQSLAEEFMKKYPYIFVAVTGGGSGTGIASLINKTCDIADCSRRMKEKEIVLAKRNGIRPKEYIVGYDGIAVVVNPKNPINKLTIDELSDIFSGKIRNWKQFGGKNRKIVLLSREVSSGTYVYFKEHVLRKGNPNDKTEYASTALLLSSSQAVVEEVAQNPDAIGYFGMGYLCNKVKSIAVARNREEKYYLPTIENVLDGKYPISRPLFVYTPTKGKKKKIIDLYINFIFSDKGQRQFVLNGFVPVRKIK